MTSEPSPTRPPAPRSVPQLLGDRVFGIWFAGNLLSNSGNWLYNVTAVVVVYNLTGSALLVGLVSVAQFASLAVLSPWAGALSDRLDRRKVLVASQAFAAACATALAVVTAVAGVDALPGGPWPVIATSAGIGIGIAFAGPALQSLVPALVPDRDLENAVALTSLTFNIGRALGPAVAGVLLATAGAEVAFAVNAASFGGLLVALAFVRPRALHREGRGDRSVRAGLAYVRRDRTVLGLLLGVGAAGFATDPVNTLAPPLAATLGGGDGVVAVLVSAFGTGAVLSALAAGRVQRRLGLATAGRTGCVVLAAGCALAAVAPHPAVAVAGFATMGCGFLVALTSFTTLLQRRIPETLRGRVMALWIVAFLGTRPLAAVIDGVAADRFGVRPAFMIAVTVALLGGALAGRLAARPDPTRPAAT